MRDLVLLPGFMCDEDLWTDMVLDLKAIGRIHYGNVYEDSTLEGMAERALGHTFERGVLVDVSIVDPADGFEVEDHVGPQILIAHEAGQQDEVAQSIATSSTPSGSSPNR